MARINKSAEILAGIAKRSVISQSELVKNRELLNLFSGASTTPKRRIVDTVALLSKQGFVSVGTIDEEIIYKVTLKGLQHLARYRETKYAFPQTGPWDGNWYIISFEIPESRKATRNNLILQLKKAGFYNYTKGLWIYPFDPTDFLQSIRKRLQLDSEIHLIVAISLDDEARLKRQFSI